MSKQTDSHTVKWTSKWMDRWMDGSMYRQTDRQTDWQTDRQTDRQVHVDSAFKRSSFVNISEIWQLHWSESILHVPLFDRIFLGNPSLWVFWMKWQLPLWMMSHAWFISQVSKSDFEPCLIMIKSALSDIVTFNRKFTRNFGFFDSGLLHRRSIFPQVHFTPSLFCPKSFRSNSKSFHPSQSRFPLTQRHFAPS